jgi:hypothetical protein
MPKTTKQGKPRKDELPSTLQRSKGQGPTDVRQGA